MLADDESVLLADGFEDAFLGIGRIFVNSPVAVYDRRKCMDILKIDMDEDEAEEYFSYNVEGAYVGDSTPMFMIKFSE